MIAGVKIGGIHYTVTVVDDLHDTDDDGRKRWLYGHIVYADALIKVARDQAEPMQVATVWHEALHGILHQAGHDDHNEAIIIALGYGIAQLIRDNPELVALTIGNEPTGTTESG